jgi:hypothetical protein
MNAKTAKKLRNIAMAMVVGAEQQGNQIERVTYVTKAKAPEGALHPGTIYVASNTFKGAYKALKKGVRNGTINGNMVRSA